VQFLVALGGIPQGVKRGQRTPTKIVLVEGQEIEPDERHHTWCESNKR